MAKQKRKGRKKVTKRKVQPKVGFNKKELWPVVILLVLTALAYIRAAGYEFVNWDDDFNIAKNPYVQVLDWPSFKGIFTSHVIGNYNPLSTLSFAIENHFFGLDPSVFHVNNILLHLVCVFLVYRLSRLLGMPMWAALAVSALFGIHPMRVESVVWVTERKDVLFGAFYLGALVNYVKFLKTSRKKKYVVWIVVLFILSLLSKIQAVALPLSMLAIDYLLKRKLSFKLVFEKWHYFGLSLVFGLIGVYFLGEQGSLDSTSNYNLIQRLLVGVYSYDIYLIKFLVPFRISPLYPYPAAIPVEVYLAPILFAGVCFLAWKAFKKAWRPLLFGLAFFTFNVMFVLQVVGAGQGFLADRFTYIPYLGLMYALGHYGYKFITSGHKYASVTKVLAGIWCVLLLAQTWVHVPVWKDSGALWTHVMKYYTNTPLPYRNRAQHLRDQGQHEQALADYNRSIELKKDPDVVNSRARLYFNQQKWNAAIQDYDLAIQLDGTVGEYWINRGAAYAMIGNMQSALADMSQGITLDPDFANGYKNRSLVYQSLNRPVEAHEDLKTYLRINPYDPDIWYESGRLYRLEKNNAEALSAFNKAITFNPNKGEFWNERSKVHLAMGNKPQAQSDLARAESLGLKIDAQTKALYR